MRRQSCSPLVALATAVLIAAFSDTPRAQSPSAAQTVPEMAAMIVYSSYAATGLIELSGSSQGGNANTTFTGTYEITASKPLPKRTDAGIFLALVPGVEHSFQGRAYLPAPDAAFTIKGNVKASLQSDASGGWAYSGKIVTGGALDLDADEVPHFRIEVPASGTLRFLVTDRGYEYVSGAGVVTTPDGNTHVFGDVGPSGRTTAALPVRASASRPSEDLIARLQTALKSAGYDPGPIDGSDGPRTRAALRRYQKDQGIAPSGQLEAQTKKALGMLAAASKDKAPAEAILPRIGAETMASMMQQWGYRAEIDYSSSDRGHLLSGAQGVPFVVAFYDCAKPTQCEDVQFRARFGTSYEGTIQDCNAWNMKRRHVQADFDEETGVVSLSMDVMVHGGTTRQNLEEYLSLWARSLARFERYLSSAH